VHDSKALEQTPGRRTQKSYRLGGIGHDVVRSTKASSIGLGSTSANLVKMLTFQYPSNYSSSVFGTSLHKYPYGSWNRAPTRLGGHPESGRRSGRGARSRVCSSPVVFGAPPLSSPTCGQLVEPGVAPEDTGWFGKMRLMGGLNWVGARTGIQVRIEEEPCTCGYEGTDLF
jgi:hypothetical protein